MWIESMNSFEIHCITEGLCNGISVTALNLYIHVIRISMILRCTSVQ